VIELPGTGTPLICLHGYSDLADTWRPLMRALQHTGRHVIAVDLPGFGRATPLAAGPVLPQLDGFVATLVREVAAATGEQAVLVGNSLGGCASLRAAADPGLPIAVVVPISPAGFGHSLAIKLAETRRELAPLLERGRVPMPVVRRVMEATFRRAACPNPRRADREAVRAWVDQFQTREDLVRIMSYAAPVIAELQTSPRDTAIEVPILLLWGDRDRLTLHGGARHLLAANPHTEFVPLHGSGHCPQLEIAPRIARLITEFVDRVAAANGHPLTQVEEEHS
jgi:pimeloyl-ACP methyl ester carboxylesterase